jgi:hypothetical protein
MTQLAAVASYSVYFLQGKFFSYHVLPAALFAFLSLWIQLCRRTSHVFSKHVSWSPLLAAYLATAIFLAGLFFIGFDDQRPILRDRLWARELSSPTAMAISPTLEVGFPLAREIRARWVYPLHSQWIANYSRIALKHGGLSEAKRSILQAYYRQEIKRTRATIRSRIPEILIIAVHASTNWLLEELLASDPELLADYEPVAEEGVFRILKHKDGAPIDTRL